MVDSIERAVLATRIGGVVPLVCTMTPATRSCSHGIVGLLITVRWIDSLVAILAVQRRIRVVSRYGSGPLLLASAHVRINIAVGPRRAVTMAIVTPVPGQTTVAGAVRVTCGVVSTGSARDEESASRFRHSWAAF